MNPSSPTPSTNIEKAKKQVRTNTPENIIMAIAAQMDRMDEAKRRIEEEGVVVRDLTGAVIAHPAIKIEADAIKLLAELMKKNGKL